MVSEEATIASPLLFCTRCGKGFSRQDAELAEHVAWHRLPPSQLHHLFPLLPRPEPVATAADPVPPERRAKVEALRASLAPTPRKLRLRFDPRLLYLLASSVLAPLFLGYHELIPLLASLAGTRSDAVVISKHKPDGSRERHGVVVDLESPGQAPHRASIDVLQGAYERLEPGQRVRVAYFPSFLDKPALAAEPYLDFDVLMAVGAFFLPFGMLWFLRMQRGPLENGVAVLGSVRGPGAKDKIVVEYRKGEQLESFEVSDRVYGGINPSGSPVLILVDPRRAGSMTVYDGAPDGFWAFATDRSGRRL